MEIEPRIKRLQFILETLNNGVKHIATDEYRVCFVDRFEAIRNRRPCKVLFIGFGASYAIPMVVRDVFRHSGSQIPILIKSGYTFHEKEIDSSCLVVINSYSGNTKECCLALAALSNLTDNLLILTGEGLLYDQALRLNQCILVWKIKNPDSEYPMFNVFNMLAVFFDILAKLNLVDWSYRSDLLKMPKFPSSISLSVKGALGRYIRVICSENYRGMAELFRLFVNEIAMVPVFINEVHEYAHTSIACMTEPVTEECLVIIRGNEDRLTQDRLDIVRRLAEETDKVECMVYEVVSPESLSGYAAGILDIMHFSYQLASQYNTPSKNLISKCIGNPAYYGEMAEKRGGRDVG